MSHKASVHKHCMAPRHSDCQFTVLISLKTKEGGGVGLNTWPPHLLPSAPVPPFFPQKEGEGQGLGGWKYSMHNASAMLSRAAEERTEEWKARMESEWEESERRVGGGGEGDKASFIQPYLVQVEERRGTLERVR